MAMRKQGPEPFQSRLDLMGQESPSLMEQEGRQKVVVQVKVAGTLKALLDAETCVAK